MTIGRYLKDKLPTILVFLMSLVVVSLVLWVFGLDRGAILFICAILFLGIVLSFAYDYMRRRSFYRKLQTTLDSLEEAYLITEIVDRPSFLEGEICYDALAQATKAMNDRIGSYTKSSREYREYIETWIHEVKTPIATAHLVAENHRDVATEAMDSELDRIEGYVDQALYYSRGNTLEKDYSIRAVKLEDVVKEALRRNARLFIDNGVTPELDDLDYEVFTDPKWVVFIIGQLFGNAIKYKISDDDQRETSARKPKVSISASQLHTGLGDVNTVLSISDNGIGISKADMPRVFDKGFTGASGRKYAKSTGIGLYLCKQLCEKMGLGISIESEEGVSTTVRVSFPQDKTHLILKKS